jgi:hypothetical protein
MQPARLRNAHALQPTIDSFSTPSFGAAASAPAAQSNSVRLHQFQRGGSCYTVSSGGHTYLGSLTVKDRAMQCYTTGQPLFAFPITNSSNLFRLV